MYLREGTVGLRETERYTHQGRARRVREKRKETRNSGLAEENGNSSSGKYLNAEFKCCLMVSLEGEIHTSWCTTCWRSLVMNVDVNKHK